MTHKIKHYNDKEEELLSDARIKVALVRKKFFNRYKSYLKDKTANELKEIYQSQNDIKSGFTRISLDELQQGNEYKNFSNTLENSFVVDVVEDAADLLCLLKKNN